MISLGGNPRKLATGGASLPAIAALILAGTPATWAFQQNAATQNSDQAEISTTHETQPTFKLKTERNLVTVRVVVRDTKGNVLGNLHKGDFRLLDNGKPQSISEFSVEVPVAKASTAGEPKEKPADNETQPESATLASSPQRYLALFFDDVHMEFEDVSRTREAANGYLEKSLQSADRVGIFTSSGQGIIEFTDDFAKIHNALYALQPRPLTPRENDPCPDISPYQAYLIVDRREPFAIEIAAQEDLQCRYNNDPRYLSNARAEAEAVAMRSLNFAETESEASLRELEHLISRMQTLPGQRNIALVSPGFMTESQTMRVSALIDRALHSKVIISALDSQGLAAAIPLGDASQRGIMPARADLAGNKTQLRINEFSYNSDVMAELANSTGGTFFHNSNDLNEGFRRVGTFAAVYYVLTFSPQNLKLDGRFHNLKVTLNNSKGLSVQARRGYYAPNKPADPATQEKEEIQEAVFSQEEKSELPIDVHTQFFRVSQMEAKLSVMTHVDLRFVHFRKQDGRNLDNLTLVTVLFDRDGQYLAGRQKTLQMRLLDASLERLNQSGITMKMSFDVKPGTYLVRQVVRDAEGAQVSGLNRTVEIPY